MIKIFQRGRGGDTFKPPPPMNNYCLYPPPVLRCFWKDPPTPHHPTSSILHCYLLPIHHPSPPKNFDHTLCSSIHISYDHHLTQYLIFCCFVFNYFKFNELLEICQGLRKGWMHTKQMYKSSSSPNNSFLSFNQI